MSDREIREIGAFLALKAREGLGDRGIWEMVQRYGSGAAALKAVNGQGDLLQPVPPFPGPSSPTSVEGPGRRGNSRGSAQVREWLDKGMEILAVTFPDFPEGLLELTDPPPLLFLRGRASLLHNPGVAVVGARRATEAGRRLAEALGRVLAGAGIPVVSGMARGIDAAAHRGALEAGGPTIAVLGTGMKVVYPPGHRGLFRELARKGLAVSEFLPDEPAYPHHFPRRNRIIAALSRAVVVVEAGARSGAFITVDHALDLGRDILAFPGSVENPQALGTNRLLRDGARLLTHPEAILDEVPGLVDEIRPRNQRGEIPDSQVPAELQPLLAALEQEPRPLETLARVAGLSTGEVAAGLTALELMGRARRCPGMRFRRG